MGTFSKITVIVLGILGAYYYKNRENGILSKEKYKKLFEIDLPGTVTEKEHNKSYAYKVPKNNKVKKRGRTVGYKHDKD